MNPPRAQISRHILSLLLFPRKREGFDARLKIQWQRLLLFLPPPSQHQQRKKGETETKADQVERQCAGSWWEWRWVKKVDTFYKNVAIKKWNLNGSQTCQLRVGSVGITRKRVFAVNVNCLGKTTFDPCSAEHWWLVQNQL